MNYSEGSSNSGTWYKGYDGVVYDYGQRWAYGYIVAIEPMVGEPDAGTLFGVWVGPDEVVYRDRVVHIESVDEATRLGKFFGQRAIWDLREQKEVWL